MENIAILIIVFLIVLWLMVRQFRKREVKAIRLMLNTQLVSSHVRQFRPQFEAVIADDYDVLTWVALEDLIRADSKDQSELPDIHLDFVLLDKLNGKPAGVLQLQQSTMSVETSKSVLQILKQLQLPLVTLDTTEDDLSDEQILRAIKAKLEPTILVKETERRSEIKIYLEPKKESEPSADIRLNLD